MRESRGGLSIYELLSVDFLTNWVKDFIRFLFWAFRGCEDLYIRHRLQQGHFWLVLADECSASGNSLFKRNSIIDPGRRVVLADNYQETVMPGVVFFLRSTPQLSEEACSILGGTWGFIPDTVRWNLLVENNLT
jgi:hypothetical protein